MKRLVCILLLLLLAGALPAPAFADNGPEVYVATVDGMIAEGAASRVRKAIDRAEDRDAAALIIRLDTPGGLSTAMNDVIRAVDGSSVPVIVYVGPAGAQAFSAGTFILLSSHLAAMAPATSIGACQPRIIDPATGTAEPAPQKEINAFSKKIESIAESRGRNQTAARRFVTENLAYTPDEAAANNTVELVAENLTELVTMADGMAIRGTLQGRANVTLTLIGADIVHIDWTYRDTLVDYLTDPQIASLLLTIGILGLVMGFLTPGFHVPEVVGAILLVLALYGLSFIGVNAAGVLLLVLAFVFMAVEAYTPTFGLWTTAAVVTLIFGIVLIPASDALYEMPTDWFTSFRLASIAVAVIIGGFFAYALYASLKTKRSQPRMGDEEFIGRTAVAVTDIDPEGQVKVRGKLWNAESQEPIMEGDEVVVTGKQRMTLHVKKRNT
ncbi:MAG: nodulation protein NfeD [Thermoplasmatota archaeon]